MICDACGGSVKKGKCKVCGKTFETATAPESAPKKPTNKKMKFCKACGAEIAKSAKI